MSSVLTARDLVLRKGNTPMNIEVEDGLTVIQTGRESSGTTLALALAGRFRPYEGEVDGPGFKKTALAGVQYIDSIERQVPVREAIREQVAWAQPFFSRTPKDILSHKFVEKWLEPLNLTTLNPQMTTGDLDVVTRFRVRILLALVSRPDAELLVVDDIDQIKDMRLRQTILEDLECVAETVPTIVLTVNEEL